MQTVTLASIYELQGLTDEAIQMYQNILKDDPHNKDASMALKRLSGKRKSFKGVNEDMKDFFINMDNSIEYLEFERWMVKVWR